MEVSPYIYPPFKIATYRSNGLGMKNVVELCASDMSQSSGVFAMELHCEFWYGNFRSGERGKRDFDCDKQVEKAVTASNCVLKGSWGEGGSGGIRKKLKSEYAAYLESKYRRNDGSLI